MTPLIFAAMWLAAIVPGLLAVSDLRWPYDLDGFRDLAAAQALRDGASIGADPLYRGETAWYNPLVPAIVAALAALLDQPVPLVHVRAGAWLNALVPIAFFLCCRQMTGERSATLAAIGFLFLPGRPPAWAAATYTPWLFPAAFAQGLFYATVAMWLAALQRRSRVLLISAGALIGLTVLAHTAAGLVLGAVVSVTGVAVCFRSRPRPVEIAWLTIVPAVTAFAVASPYLLPLWRDYGFDVVNRAPGGWVDEPTMPARALGGFVKPGAWLHLAVVATGIRRLWRTASFEARLATGVWAGVGIALYTYCSMAAAAGAPTLVPAYHFFFLVRAVKWMLFGAGLASIVEYLSARDWLARTRLSSSVVLAAGSLVAVAALYPRYLGREAFTRAAQMSRESAAGADRMAYDWIVTRTSRGTVFLASDIDALRVVAPAGRSVVSVVPEFSNPYVDYQRRAAMKSALESALDSGDAATFMRLSRAAGVTHVLLRDADRNAALRRGAMPLREVFRSGSLSVFEVATTP